MTGTDALTFAANHVWQSTIFAALAALIALALRRQRAQVRYWVWLAASLKFLLPFAVLTAIGGALSWRTVEVIPYENSVALIETVSQPFSQTQVTVRRTTSQPDGTPLLSIVRAMLLPVWGLGSAIFLVVWAGRWRRVNAMRRRATRIREGREVQMLQRLATVHGVRPLPIFETDTALEPGIFGVTRPILLWPRGISDHLSDDEVEAILAHELCHVRRQDNLAAALHMAVQTVFWFHPLVWWIGARLVDERERACDEEVLTGSEPTVYAEGILKTCKFSLESPLACVSGVTGSDLKKRIETIMRNSTVADLRPMWKLALVTAGLSTLAGPILLGVVSAGAQQAPATAPKPAFETASVKWNRSGEGRVMIRNLPGGGYEAINVTVRSMIQTAYRMQEFQVLGGPSWLAEERIDIVARSPESGAPADLSLRLQSLLEERFRLVTHTETREAPIYALVLARADGRFGESIKPSTVDCASPAGRMAMPPALAARGAMPMMPPDLGPLGSRACTAMSGGNRIMGGGQTMAEIARVLQAQTGRIVQDRTSLTGRFDFDLAFTPDPALRGRGMGGGLPGLPERPFDPDGLSIFTAVQEQLGLKLESARGPVDVIVIDSVERLIED